MTARIAERQAAATDLDPYPDKALERLLGDEAADLPRLSAFYASEEPAFATSSARWSSLDFRQRQGVIARVEDSNWQNGVDPFSCGANTRDIVDVIEKEGRQSLNGHQDAVGSGSGIDLLKQLCMMQYPFKLLCRRLNVRRLAGLGCAMQQRERVFERLPPDGGREFFPNHVAGITDGAHSVPSASVMQRVKSDPASFLALALRQILPPSCFAIY